jgi:hypothetical protein
MDWSQVGAWLKNNAGAGAALVGSLLTGNIPGAVAAGVSLVSSATGSDDPTKALQALQTDPSTMIRLKELAVQEDALIRQHIHDMEKLRLEDLQAAHKETQETIRSGDNAEDVVVRRTRPLQSWASLLAAFGYITARIGDIDDKDIYVIGLLLTLPWAYAGLREIGKGLTTWKGAKQ